MKRIECDPFQKKWPKHHSYAEGKQLLSEATQILDQLDKTIQLFKQQSHRSANHLYGYEESDVSQMMLPLVQTFEQQSKSLTPQLMTHEDIVEQVVSGQLDIGFVELTKEIWRNLNYIQRLYLKKIIICMCPRIIQLQ